MAVIIGSARSDERGKITGGKAGDQKSGKEVSTQNYYVHSKGWRVLRAKDAAKRKLIAQAMKAACANNNIGYDQSQRNTLYYRAQPYNFDPSKVASSCETDCSALVRVCCAFAGIKLGDFNTSTEAKVLLASGAFDELTDSKYTKKSDYLMAGDILVTKTKGHTVIVLSDGNGAENEPVSVSYKLGDRILRNGSEGEDVKELQRLLIQLDYDLGKWGADGAFGDATELAVRFLQKKAGIVVDGEFGPASMKALEAELKVEDGDGVPEKAKYVRIKGGNCFVRSGPTTSKDNQLGVAYEGKLLPYRGETSVDGWLAVEFNSKDGWVSGKYGRLEV